MSTLQRIWLRTAEQLEGLREYDYAALTGTTLGQALTRGEIRDLADKPDEIKRLAVICREEAARHSGDGR